MKNLLCILTNLIVLFTLSSCITFSVSATPNATNAKPIILQTKSPDSQSIYTTATTQSTPASTQMIVPTLTEKDARAEIIGLLSNLKTCRLPCWWGMLPQQTRTIEVQEMLQRFSVYSVEATNLNSKKGYTQLLIPQSGNSYLNISLAYKGKDETLEWIWLQMEIVHKASNSEGESWYETSWDDPQLANFSEQYRLSNILSEYGKPSEILIFTRQTALINQPLPISTVLFYPNYGFMIEYVANGILSRSTENVIDVTGCLSLASPIFLLWSPSQEMNLVDVVSLFSSEHLYSEGLLSGKYKTVEEATGMNIEEFYEAFTTDNNRCIATPSNLWPMPGE